MIEIDEQTERWKPVPGFGGWYDVSDMGRMRLSRARGNIRVSHHILKLFKKSGYLCVNLSYAGRKKMWYIHRLVLETFRGPCPPEMEAIHIDEDRLNNSLRNLKWGTHKENMGMPLARRRNSKAAKLCYQNPEARKKTSASHPVGKSGYRGVVRNGRGWQATIKVDGRMIHIGRFDSARLAALAWDRHVRKHKLPRMTNRGLGLFGPPV